MRRWAELGTMTRGRRGALCLVLAASLISAVGGIAHAQGRNGPLSGSGPVDIAADELEVVDAENRAVWKGNVNAIQNGARMTTPLLNVYFAQGTRASTDAAGGSIERMEADGPVYYATQTQNARGNHATYLATNNTVTITGQVVLVQGQNVVQGDKLVIDTTTNKATWAKSSNRVRGVFYPNQGSPSASPAPAKPAAAPQAAPARR